MTLLAVFGSVPETHAEGRQQPDLAGTPLDLINAVNALRASYGLPPYTISSILMYTAQAQADFMAATGTMTHAGPGGIGLTDRLLAAGYPLAGDLSAGGFRSENITGGRESMPAQAAVDRWTGDSIHLNTMISPDLTEIGAGVAVNNGRVYYVIDCARPTTSAEAQAAGASSGSGSPMPAVSPSGIIFPVSLSTPNARGEIIHEVKPGQSLWQIAIAYGAKIDEIKTRNALFDNSIFPGQKLLIKTGVATLTAQPTKLPTQPVTLVETDRPAVTATAKSVTAAPTSLSTPVPVTASATVDNNMIMKVAMGIIAFALLGGGFFAWLGSRRKE